MPSLIPFMFTGTQANLFGKALWVSRRRDQRGAVRSKKYFTLCKWGRKLPRSEALQTDQVAQWETGAPQTELHQALSTAETLFCPTAALWQVDGSLLVDFGSNTPILYWCDVFMLVHGYLLMTYIVLCVFPKTTLQRSWSLPKTTSTLHSATGKHSFLD